MKDISSYRFIGVDTHKDQHTAAVIDCFNRCLGIVEPPPITLTALTRPKNRFHSLIREQYPTYESMFKDPFSKAGLVFWQRFPSPSDLRHMGIKRLTSFLLLY
jgi:hypothetical protein